MTYQGQTVSVQIPQPIFRRLQRVAKITHRSVEDVLATTVNVALPQAPDLPDELADELAAMTMFSDEALWAATEPSLSPAQQRRLSQLTHAGGSRSLTAAESAELENLLYLYDRSILRRAQALAILAHRGYEIPDRVDLPASIDDDDENPQTVERRGTSALRLNRPLAVAVRTVWVSMNRHPPEG